MLNMGIRPCCQTLLLYMMYSLASTSGSRITPLRPCFCLSSTKGNIKVCVEQCSAAYQALQYINLRSSLTVLCAEEGLGTGSIARVLHELLTWSSILTEPVG